MEDLKFQEYDAACNFCTWYEVFACNGKPRDGEKCPYQLNPSKDITKSQTITDNFQLDCEKALEPVKTKYQELFQKMIEENLHDSNGN